MTLMIISCSQDVTINIPTVYPYTWQPSTTDNNGQYSIGGYIAGSSKTTRASAITSQDILDNYSSFSIFGWTKDSIPLNNYNGVFNIQEGTWGYMEPRKYFDNNQASYSFIGILPQSNSYVLKSDSTIDVSLIDFITEGVDVNAQKYNKEFITAKTSINKENYANGATLVFEHQNSIVRIKFETDNTNNLEILDFTPGIQATIYNKIAQGPRANTTTSNYKYGTNAPCFSGSGSAPDIADEVNAQWNYYTNADGTGDASTTDWRTGELKPYVQLKPAYYNNDVFINLANNDLKNLCKPIMDSGYRVCRIDNKPGSNEWEIFFIYLNNISTTTITGGKKGIVVLPATSANQTGKDAILGIFPEIVTANVSINGVTYTTNTTEQKIIFTKPGVVAYSVYSPTNWYTFPVTHETNFGFTIKFSYTLNGVTRYDARVFVPATKCNWQPGKWYDYVIKVNSTKHGKSSQEDADEDDPRIEEEFPIIINSSSIDQYSSGQTHTFNL